MAIDGINGSDICTACGLCCDGTLYTNANLDPDEVEGARATGLSVVTIKKQASISLPCVKLCGTRCGVYESRPRICGVFECATLIAAKDRKISVDEANRRIAQVRAALDRARPEFLPGESFPDARRRFRQTVVAPGSVSASPMFKLHMGTLALLLDKYFRLPNGKMFSD